MSDIEKLRNEMEKITADMLKLLKIRTGIAKEIGNLKNEHGLTVTDESREDELKNKMMKICDETGFGDSFQNLISFYVGSPEFFLLNEVDDDQS